MSYSQSKKHKFAQSGLFFTEINEFLRRELAEEGYDSCTVKSSAAKTEVKIKASKPQGVLGEKGKRLRELTLVIEKRFRLPEGNVEISIEKIADRGLSAAVQCESLKFKLVEGLAVRRAAYSVLRFVMESGAQGCEVCISGKIRAARAKVMKFNDGFMIHA